MKPIINRHMFTQSGADSGSITMLSTVVHKFSEPGDYHGNIIKGQNVVGHFTLSVGKRQEAYVQSPAPSTQVHIDLRLLDTPVAHRLEGPGMAGSRFTVGPDGYALFKASAGPGGYAVEVYKERTKVFDSRELKEDDLLHVLVLRPGTYSVVNTLTNARAELVVAYPDRIPKNPEPVRIECTKSAIAPERISIKPMQGLVFNFKAPSRIKIDLVRPEDRPPAEEKVRQVHPLPKERKVSPSGKKVLRRFRITPRNMSAQNAK
jgi:hypothetical protein